MAAVETDFSRYVFKFSDYTTDPRLLKYDDILQKLYARILKDANVPAAATAKERGTIIGNTSKAKVAELIGELSPQFASKSNIIFYLLLKQYYVYHTPIDISVWPPIDYPDVSGGQETSVGLPPLCKVPGRKDEAATAAVIRMTRSILDKTRNENLMGKTMNDALKYLIAIRVAAKSLFYSDDVEDYPISERDVDPSLLAIAREDVRKIPKRATLGDHFVNIALALEPIEHLQNEFDKIVQADVLKGNTYLFDDRNMLRYSGCIYPTLLQIVNFKLETDLFTESMNTPLFGKVIFNNIRLVKNRDQQVFIGIPNDINPTPTLTRLLTPRFDDDDNLTEILSVNTTNISNIAWIQFNYKFPNINSSIYPELDPTNFYRPKENGKDYIVIDKCLQFQGYRLFDMPPPPVLKAFAHGPPLAMSEHVKKLYPEWTRKETLDAWLDKVMVKWRADISALAGKLVDDVCTSDSNINQDVRYLRDVPATQLELYNNTLQYIIDRRMGKPFPVSASSMLRGAGNGLQGGGRRKTHTKSKEMRHRTSKQQRGGASMPLAYFQDGAQMRGTYAEPTGVGLSAATNSMARSAIQQTGGRRSRKQAGGFAPSLMGSFVSNGMALTPVASFMTYRMLKGPKGRRMSRYTHRGPRSTQKKRRSTRRS